jgi:hypothetical protein
VLFTLLLLFNSVTDVSTIGISNDQYDMTRFASLGQNRASDYAAAGRVVANEASKAFNATRSFNPNYTDLAVQGMKARNYEKRAAWAAQEKMAKSGINAVAGVQKTKVVSDARADISNTQTKSRKAGKLAAMGGLIAKAAITPRKVERPGIVTLDRSSDITAAQKELDEATAKQRAFLSKDTPPSAEVATGPTTPTTSTGSHTVGKDGLYSVGIVELGQRLQDNFGLTVVEHPEFGGVNGGHARHSHHDFGEAIDVQDWRPDVIDGVHWTDRTSNLRDLLRGSGHEVLGPGDGGHETHLHLGNHGGTFSLNQQQYDYLFGGNSGGKNATFVLNNS